MKTLPIPKGKKKEKPKNQGLNNLDVVLMLNSLDVDKHFAVLTNNRFCCRFFL